MASIFKFFLSLIGFSIGSLFIASTLSWLELAALASIANTTAIFTWLSAYIVISLQTGYFLLSSAFRQLQRYFSPVARNQRRLLFIQNRHEQLKRRHAIHRAHLNYIYETKRLKLLKANNKKYSYSLSTTADHDKHSLKQQMAKKTLSAA